MRLFKFCCLPSLLVALLYGHALFAQTNHGYRLYLRNGTITPTANLSDQATGAPLRVSEFSGIGRLVIIQFNDIPTERSVELLKNAGIELLDYVPDNAYTAVIRKAPDAALFVSANARAIIELTPGQKIHFALTESTLPAHAVKAPGKVDVAISYPRSIALSDVRQDLQRNNFEIVSESLSNYQVLEVRLDTNRLEQLAALPWLQYIEPISAPSEPLNDKSTAGTRANMLAAGLPSGVKLDGEGVTIGIGDYSSPYSHADINRRVVSNDVSGSYWHGVHVAGTAAGAGIVNEKYKGYAPKASIVMRLTRSILDQVEELFRDFGMVVANHSYGPLSNGDTCPGFGRYSSYSNLLDRQENELPYLLHVFAAGNSGNVAACDGTPAGFGNVHGDYASAKNIISVGQTVATQLISPSSSKGPVKDGRIKPDIVAQGTSVFSAIPGDTYDDASGTSMSAPAVTGGAALLYQRYRQLYNQQNPKNGLVKAFLLNGASDKGLSGPDFSYGFGLMNLFRSVTMMEKGHYLNGTLAHQAMNEFQITVPPGTAVVKAMLYWNDIAASPLGGQKSLVNNLDLEAARPDGTRLLPLVPNASTPAVPAVASLDSVNNAEQIVIENAAAGNYTLRVKGSKIPSGPQEYFLVYDIIEKSTTLAYPVGNEHFTKGDAIYISWDSYGNPASTFAVSYSLNNGATWTTINAAVTAGSNQLSWTVPDATTASAKIRLVQNETGLVTESAAFSIMPVPIISLAAVQCPGYVAVQWTAVSGASDYEVMRLQGTEMKSVATTSALKYTFSDLSRDSLQYITVRPRINGVPGRRAVAVRRKPDSGTCAGTISDNDIAIDSIISPNKSGREFTTISLSSTQQVIIGLRNLDDQPITRSFEVGYSTGGAGSTVHWETISSGMPAQGYLRYTFSKTANFQSVGTYPVSFFVKLDGDLVTTNNTRAIIIKQLANPPLALPYAEDFESFAEQTSHFSTIGLANADKYDFTSEDNFGRLRTYVKPGLAYSGIKALTIDTDSLQTNMPGYMTEARGTYNLAGYHIQKDEIQLTFRFRNLSWASNEEGVFIRGKDTDPWIYAIDNNSVENAPVDKDFVRVKIEVSNLLKRNAQNFTASFQVMWRQKVYRQASASGYTFDDIQIVAVQHDAAAVRIVPPALSNCSDGPHEFGVVVRNNGPDDFIQLPLQMTVDGNEVYRGNVPVVKAGRDTLYAFTFDSGLFSEGDHVVKAMISRDYDFNNENDSTHLVINIPPPVQALPYLENFENGQGGWFTVGVNSAWQFGHPASTKVKGAASGRNAWKTNLTGPYQNEGISYLYSPCIDLPAYSRTPMISFSVSMDMEPCNANSCDLFFLEYSTGGPWYRVTGGENSTNWFNTADGTPFAWNVQDYTRWHVATGPGTYGSGKLRFRFGFQGGSSGTREGVAIDDFHVYDLDFYGSIAETGLSNDSLTNIMIYGDWWTKFTSLEGLYMSLNANNQTLEGAVVKPFIRKDATPSTNNQFYLPRSYTVTTAEASYPEPVGVRIYFTDKEVESMLAAPDKTGVTKPGSAYDLTVSQYSGVNEDGNLLNNASTKWTYYPKSAMKIVPYRNGYYAEFQTKSFSEFWLAKDFLGTGDPMPVTLAAFSAIPHTNAENKQTALLEWQTTQEEAFSHFEIEVAKDKEGLLKKLFVKIGAVPGKSGGSLSTNYSFTDHFPAAEGTSYYRLKMVDQDGSFTYSSIRAVTFEGEREWKVFPNPVDKKIFVEFEEKADKLLRFNIYDVEGRGVFTEDVVTSGAVQKKEIDLSSRAVIPGIYLLKVASDDRERVFKIIKK